MDDEIKERLDLKCVPTIVKTYIGMNVFEKKQSLQYFNKETILKSELQRDTNLKEYLDDRNLISAVHKIFDKTHNPLRSSNGPYNEDSFRLEEPENTPHMQMVKKFRMDLSLEDMDSDASISLSLPGTPAEANLSPRRTPRRLFAASESSASPRSQTSSLSSLSSGTTTQCLQSQEPYFFTDNHKDEAICEHMISLFWLMSIAPRPAALACKAVLDSNTAWRVSLYDVIMILLNWGATLESFDLAEAFGPTLSKKLAPSLPPGSLSMNYSTLNIHLVMTVLSQRLPGPEMPDSHRIYLLRCLVRAALDNELRDIIADFQHAVIAILESFPCWNHSLAYSIAEGLQLSKLQHQNGCYVACCILNLSTDRTVLVGMISCHMLLQQLFCINTETSLSAPPVKIFSRLVDQLDPPFQLVERFQDELWKLFIIAQFIHSLLIRHGHTSPPCSQESVEKLQEWTKQLREALKRHPSKFNLDSGKVRERLSRVSADCINVSHAVHGLGLSQTNNSQYNCYADSPVK